MSKSFGTMTLTTGARESRGFFFVPPSQRMTHIIPAAGLGEFFGHKNNIEKLKNKYKSLAGVLGTPICNFIFTGMRGFVRI